MSKQARLLAFICIVAIPTLSAASLTPTHANVRASETSILPYFAARRLQAVVIMGRVGKAWSRWLVASLAQLFSAWSVQACWR